MFKKSRFLFLILIVIIVLPCATLFAYRYYQTYKETKRINFISEKRKNNWFKLKQELEQDIAKFNGEVGIIIKDLVMDWEISFNKDKLFPSASLAKMPIMVACFLAVEEAKLKLEQKIKLRSGDKVSGAGILKTTFPDTEFTVGRLIGLMIYESDNTATNILTNLLGLEYLNNVFKTLGLKNTNLSRKIADYSLREKGIENYTTAEDMALLLEKIYRKNLVNKNISEKCLELLKLQRINDRIPKYLPVEATVAHKTGLEQNICHDCGIVFTKKGDFIICVLTKHKEPSGISAKEFIAKISLYVHNYFEQT